MFIYYFNSEYGGMGHILELILNMVGWESLSIIVILNMVGWKCLFIRIWWDWNVYLLLYF